MFHLKTFYIALFAFIYFEPFIFFALPLNLIFNDFHYDLFGFLLNFVYFLRLWCDSLQFQLFFSYQSLNLRFFIADDIVKRLHPAKYDSELNVLYWSFSFFLSLSMQKLEQFIWDHGIEWKWNCCDENWQRRITQIVFYYRWHSRIQVI